jgi:chromate transporter
VLSTSTFIGYQIQGFWGAVVATIGIFLPSFIFVALLNPLIPKMRQSLWASAFLDTVNVSALGLMTAVLFKLGMAVLLDWKGWLIATLSLFVFFRYKKVNSAWLVLGGAILGYMLQQIEMLL